MAAVETKTMSLMELPTDALGLICDHLVATYVQAMRIHARVYNTIYGKHIGDYYQMTDGRMLVDVAFDGEREEGHGSMLYPVRRFALKSEWRTIFGDRRSEQKRVDPRLNLRSFEDWKKYYRVQQYMKELIADFHALDLTCRHMHSRVVPWARLYAAVRAHMDQHQFLPRWRCNANCYRVPVGVASTDADDEQPSCGQATGLHSKRVPSLVAVKKKKKKTGHGGSANGRSTRASRCY